MQIIVLNLEYISLMWISINLGSLYNFPILVWRIIWGTRAQTFFRFWLALELNMFAFIGIMLFSRKVNYNKSAIKYFIVQAVSSGILLWSILMALGFIFTKLSMSFMLFSLLLKVGGAPLHWWFIDILLSLEWVHIFILCTIQKVLPLLGLCCMAIEIEFKVLILLGGLVSILGSWNLVLLKPLIGYSSVFRLIWIFSCPENLNCWFFFFLTYSLSLFLITFYFKIIKIERISDNTVKLSSAKNKTLFFVLFISLGGIPPILGFWGKLFVLTSLVKKGRLVLSLFLLGASVLIIYIYTRISLSVLFEGRLKVEVFSKNKERTLFFLRFLVLCSLTFRPLIVLV